MFVVYLNKNFKIGYYCSKCIVNIPQANNAIGKYCSRKFYKNHLYNVRTPTQ